MALPLMAAYTPASIFRWFQTRSIDVPIDWIERLERKGIGAKEFDFERILQFWYETLVPMMDGAIIDVGAHYGRHTEPFLELRRKVICFEPIDTLFQYLEGRFGRDSNFEIHNFALGKMGGESEFIVNDFAQGESGLRRRIYQDETNARPRSITVEVRTLDEMMDSIPKICYIKIDIEGGELDLLSGARKLLKRDCPMVSVEYGMDAYSVYGHNKMSLYRFATDNGYIVFDVFGFALKNVDEYSSVVDRYYWDYFLIPKENLRLQERILRAGKRLRAMYPRFFSN